MADTQHLTFEEVTEIRNLLALLDEFEDIGIDPIILRDSNGEVIGSMEGRSIPDESRRRHTFSYPTPGDPAR